MHPSPPEVYPAIPITAVAFSPDGKELYASGYHEVTVWNPADGKLVRRIKNLPQRIYRITLSPDGALLAIAGGNAGRLGEVRLMQRETGELVRVLGVSSDVVFAAAFHPGGERIATGAADGLVRVFEVATDKEVLSLGSHSDWVFDLAWNADGSKLASASRDGTAKVFDANGKLLYSFSEHNSPVHGVAFDLDGKHVISSGENDRIYRWRISDGKREDEYGLSDDGGLLVPAGDNLLTTSNERQVRLIKRKDLKTIRAFSDLSDWPLSVAFDADHGRVVAGTLDGKIYVWNAQNGERIAKFEATPGKPE